MSLSRKEMIVGMISGAILFPAGMWFVKHYVDDTSTAFFVGVATSLILQLVAFQTVYGFESRKLRRQLDEQLEWSRKHCEKVFADSERKFDEARIYKD